MDNIELNLIDFAKLDLKDGDIIVLRVPPDWDGKKQDNAWRAVHHVLERADVRAEILIGTKDVDLSILRPSKND